MRPPLALLADGRDELDVVGVILDQQDVGLSRRGLHRRLSGDVPGRRGGVLDRPAE